MFRLFLPRKDLISKIAFAIVFSVSLRGSGLCFFDGLPCPSVLAGVVIGLCLGQLLEWIILARLAWTVHLRQQSFWLRNFQVARARIA